jgi:hypothetical protein
MMLQQKTGTSVTELRADANGIVGAHSSLVIVIAMII